MDQDIRRPGREAAQALSERLEAVQDFFNTTTALLVKQAVTLRYARLFRTPEEDERSWREYTEAANQNVLLISKNLMSLREESGDSLFLRHPENYERFGKMTGITFSVDDYAYQGSVVFKTIPTHWPILHGSQLFIDGIRPRNGAKISSIGAGSQVVDLRTRANSVVLQHGSDSQSHSAHSLPHDGFPGIG